LATSTAKPITSASNTRIAAQIRRRNFAAAAARSPAGGSTGSAELTRCSGRAGPAPRDGDHRSGHEDPGADGAAVLGPPDRGVDGVVEPAGHLDAVGTEDLDGKRSELVEGHRPR
jgi:hypothetical protein